MCGSGRTRLTSAAGPSWATGATGQIGRGHVCTLVTPRSTLFPYTTLFRSRVLMQPPIMNGEDVRQWQDEINKRGWPLMVDGSYGPKSEKICRQIQKKNAIVGDGGVGRSKRTNTWVETI